MYKEQIDQFIDSKRSEIIETTKRLVKIPSVKGEAREGMPFGEQPNAALEEAFKIAEELGFITTNYNGYVGAIDFSDSPTALDILAHLDIVPVNPSEWKVCHPFEPTEKDGKLYGRGTADDKGPVASTLYAMKAIKELNIPLKKNVRLLVGTDEESGSSDIDYYYKKNKPAPATFSPDSSFPVTNVEKGVFRSRIVAEYPVSKELPRIISVKSGNTTNVIPDSGIIVAEGLDQTEVLTTINSWSEKTKQTAVVEKKGNQLVITTKGVGGHAAEPSKANNALTGLLELVVSLPFAKSEGFECLKSLSALFPHNDWAGKALGIQMADEVSDALTISLNLLNVNETSIDATFDSRTPICSNKENTADVVEKNCEKNGLKLIIVGIGGPHHVPADSPFINVLLNAYTEYTGLPGECQISGGGTYVHGLENAVAFGPAMPGTNNHIHDNDEFAVIDEMLLAAKIFAKVIIDLCG